MSCCPFSSPCLRLTWVFFSLRSSLACNLVQGSTDSVFDRRSCTRAMISGCGERLLQEQLCPIYRENTPPINNIIEQLQDLIRTRTIYWQEDVLTCGSGPGLPRVVGAMNWRNATSNAELVSGGALVSRVSWSGLETSQDETSEHSRPTANLHCIPKPRGNGG